MKRCTTGRSRQTIIGVSETHDVVEVTPRNGKLWIFSNPEDRSGYASLFLSEGEIASAEIPIGLFCRNENDEQHDDEYGWQYEQYGNENEACKMDMNMIMNRK
jgi:hypothetical protein